MANVKEKDSTILTEIEVRKIARDEISRFMIDIKEDVRKINGVSNENRKILERLERLLLGEMGVESEDTLKARANFAYRYARRNEDLNIIERAIPALDWFDDMKRVEEGCGESRLASLNKIIRFYSSMKLILGLLGITTLINSIPIIQQVILWFRN